MTPVPDGVEPMLRRFRYGHLPPQLREVSRPFCELAELVVQTQPASAERTVCLRKLREAKDCAVTGYLEALEDGRIEG